MEKTISRNAGNKAIKPVLFSFVCSAVIFQLLYFKSDTDIVIYEINTAAILLMTILFHLRSTRKRTALLASAGLLTALFIASGTWGPLPEDQKWILSWMTILATVPAQAAVFTFPFKWFCNIYITHYNND
jgi:O-antigen ligase